MKWPLETFFRLETKPRSAMVLAAALLLLGGCTPPGHMAGSKYSAAAIRAEYGDISERSAEEVPKTRPKPSQAAGASPEQSLDFPLSLSEAIDTAISNNANLQQAIHGIARAKALKDMADSAFHPFLGVYTEYTQGDSPSAYLFKTIDQRKLPQNLNFNDPGWFENWESGIKAQMNLFNGGKDYLARRMAEQAVSVSTQQRLAVANELTASVIAAFYDVLAAREFVRIAEASVATVSEQLRVMRVQYEGGGALKSDVLSLEVRQAEAKENLVNSRNRLQLARVGLANLMGLDPEAFPETKDPLLRKTRPPVPVPETYEEGVVQALAHRPELEQARSRLAKSRMAVDKAKADYLPSLDLVGKYYVADPGLDYERDRENWTAALMLNWDLYTGFSRQARVNKAEAMLKEMLAADRQATLDIKMDVKNAYLNRKAARARYQAADSSVASAEASYRLVKSHYEGGSATITRYLKAELDRSRARTRSAAAFYDKIKANADLARAIGKWAARHPQPFESRDRHEE